MKKLWLLGALALALASANLPAQDADSTLSVSGSLATGFGVELGSQHSSLSDHPRFYVGDWDEGYATWAQAVLQLNRGNYGLMWAPFVQLRNFDRSSVAPGNAFVMGNLNGWFTLADDMVRITVGRMGTARWHNFGADDVNYSQGLGMRVEVMPIDGLNVGFFLRPTHRTGGIGDPNAPNVDDDGNVTYTVAVTPSENRLSYALANTSFGARFAPAGGLFGIAAGLELRSQYEESVNFRQGWFTTHSNSFLQGYSNAFRQGRPETPDDRLRNLGIRAYFGANLNLIDDLTLQFGVQAYNLDDFNWSGQIWTHQAIEFDMNPLTIGMDMHQVFLSGNLSRTNFDPNRGADDHGPMDVLLRFVPHVGFDVTSDTWVGVSIPVSIAPSWSNENFTALAFGIEPSVTQQMGQGFSITARYRLGWNNQLGIEGRDWNNNVSSDTELYNTLDVRFGWSF